MVIKRPSEGIHNTPVICPDKICSNSQKDMTFYGHKIRRALISNPDAFQRNLYGSREYFEQIGSSCRRRQSESPVESNRSRLNMFLVAKVHLRDGTNVRDGQANVVSPIKLFLAPIRECKYPYKSIN